VKHLVFVCLLALGATACTHTPPTLSPVASKQFTATRVIKTLDLLRDAAIDANAQTPPLLSTVTTRKIVNYHKAALTTMNASLDGWQNAVSVALFQVRSDPSLLPSELAVLQPYFNLAQAVIDAAKAGTK
jgi:hypothetical protein